MLQELASLPGKSQPTLILACEEPELYQHPPQARHLCKVFERLSSEGAQILLCTHSPYFVSGSAFETVKLLRKDVAANSAKVHAATVSAVTDAVQAARGEPQVALADALIRMDQALQPGLNEMFFANVVILVEGLEDYAYITAHNLIAGYEDEFRTLGCHIVPCNGKSKLFHPAAVAKLLSVPAFLMFDCDGDTRDAGRRQQHLLDNRTLFRLFGYATQIEFPADPVFLPDLVAWPRNIGSQVKADIGADWDRWQDEIRIRYGLKEGSLGKTTQYIGYMLAECEAHHRRSPNLDRACQQILSFARTARGIAARAATVAPPEANK